MKIAKKLVIISIAIVTIVGYVYFANYFLEEWKTWDREFRTYLPSAVLGGIALLLVAIRNMKGANKFLLLAMGVLITGIVPFIAGLRFLMDSDLGQSLFSAAIAVFSVIWFLYFVTKQGKDRDEEKDIKNARPQIIGMFLTLIAFSLISFATIETLQNIVKQSTS